MQKKYLTIIKTIKATYAEYELEEFYNFLERNDLQARFEYSFRKCLLPFIYLETSEEVLAQVFAEEKLYLLLSTWLEKNRLTETEEYILLYHKVLLHRNAVSRKLLNERNFYGNRDNIKLAVEKHCKGKSLLIVQDSSPYRRIKFPVKSILLGVSTCPHCKRDACAVIGISSNYYLQNAYMFEFICLNCGEFSTSSEAPEVWDRWINLTKQMEHPDKLLTPQNLEGLIFDKTDKIYKQLTSSAPKLVLRDKV